MKPVKETESFQEDSRTKSVMEILSNAGADAVAIEEEEYEEEMEEDSNPSEQDANKSKLSMKDMM